LRDDSDNSYGEDSSPGMYYYSVVTLANSSS
jgi:hypothetical protein